MSVWIALVVLALPMLYRRAFTYLITRRSSQRPAQQTPAAPKSSKRLRFALVTLVSIVCICRIAIFRPRSIFDILDLPFGAPSSTIWDRLIIVYGYNPDYLPAQTAALLMRLKTLQGRQLYHHWGDLVAQPEMPSDDSQLILLQLPGLVGAYAATTAAIGWLACDQGREKWRIYLCILLAAAFGAEVYASRQPWDSNLFLPEKRFLFRYSVFLVVSLVAYFLPASPPPTTASDFVLPILERLTRDIDQLKDSVHVANLQRSTILRNPSLRAKLISFWTIAQREGEAVARDEELQRISRELQLHIDLVKDEDKPDTPIIVEGEQRQEARAFAEQSVEQLLRDLASAAQKS